MWNAYQQKRRFPGLFNAKNYRVTFNSVVGSPPWERREGGGDATRPPPGTKGGAVGILPTLPQSPRSSPSRPRPRKREQPPRRPQPRLARGRRRSLARRKTLRRRSEAPPLLKARKGVTDWKRRRAKAAADALPLLGVRSCLPAEPGPPGPGPDGWVYSEAIWFNFFFFFFLSVHFILKQTDARKEGRKEGRICAPASS